MLDTLIDDAQTRQTHFVVYGTDGQKALDERFGQMGVPIHHRPLPRHGPPPFVTIREDGSFVGALALSDLEALFAPPIVRPLHREDVSVGYRAVFDLLDDTVFPSLDRRQLLGASREIEDRAARIGYGTLRVSFQRLSAFEAQLDVYRNFARETALDLHIYGAPDWEPPRIEGVTYHGTDAPDVERHWALAFDGGGDITQACALLARGRDDEYTGFWTYDPNRVQTILDALASSD